jgi:hypothetical protein
MRLRLGCRFTRRLCELLDLCSKRCGAWKVLGLQNCEEILASKQGEVKVGRSKHSDCVESLPAFGDM